MDAIGIYKEAIHRGAELGDSEFKELTKRCLDRMQFIGQHMMAVDVHRAVIQRFDDVPYYRNQLAVTYLLAGR